MPEILGLEVANILLKFHYEILSNQKDFDFQPIGQAFKAAHKAQGMTREQLARIVDYDPRNLQAIGKEGQYPGLELSVIEATVNGLCKDLMDYKTPSYRSFSYFINEEIRDCVQDIFKDNMAYIGEKDGVYFQHLYIDGSKFEVDANKYTWVWKKDGREIQVPAFRKDYRPVDRYE